jgi:hypothetical protein
MNKDTVIHVASEEIEKEDISEIKKEVFSS